MRLEGQSKLGYYPTPPLTLQHIITHLSWPTNAKLLRTLDPCCGQGEAIAEITDGHGTAYGIELSDSRAQAAEDAIPHVINTAYEYAVLTPGTFSLVLLNSPYDGEQTTGGGKRMEETFLCDLPTTDVLVSGGVLVYIIPHSRLNERIARHLAGWYTNLQCFLLPAGEYEVFRQCVIFAQRKPDYATPERAEVQSVLAWQDGQQIAGWIPQETLDEESGKSKKIRVPTLTPLAALTTGHGEFAVPESPEKGQGNRPFKFQYTAVTDEDFAREAEECAQRLDGQRAWTDLIPPLEPPTLRPAMTPKKGHIAMQVTGGLLGTNRVTEKDGSPLLLKGHIETYWVSRETEIEVDPDKENLRKIEMEQRFRAALATLADNGEYQSTTEPYDIAALLEQHVAQLAEIMQGRNVPLYDLKPEPWEWTAFNSLSKQRALSGRNETGLTDFQKHLAIALGRLCREYGAGFINAEMGTGKTGISIALAEYLRVSDERKGRKQTVYPALVVGPGIVTGKENWPKEIPAVTPGADSRVIAVGAKPLPKAAKIGVYLRGTWKLSVNENNFFGATAEMAMAHIRQAAKAQRVALTKDVVAALLASLKNAQAHPPTKRKNAKDPNLLDGRIGGYEWLGLHPPRDESSEDDLRGKYSLAQFVQEHQAGQLPEKCFAVISYETAKLGSGRVPAMTTRHIQALEREEDGEPYPVIREVLACPACGAPVSEKYDTDSGKPVWPMSPAYAEQFIGLKRRFCQAPQPRRVWNADKGEHEIHAKDADGERYICGAPLFENSALRRLPAAEYARKQAKGVFGLCLVDECFPGNTPILTARGLTPIHHIGLGDLVYSSLDGNITLRKVTRLIVKKLRGELVTIHHTGGALTCTPNHKIYTSRGLFQVSDLKPGDTLYGYPKMFDVPTRLRGQTAIRSEQVLLPDVPASVNAQTCGLHLLDLRKSLSNQTVRQAPVLFQELQFQISSAEVSGSKLSECASPCIRENEKTQSNERPSCSSQGYRKTDWAGTRSQGRKWAINRTTEDVVDRTRLSVASGISNYDGSEVLEVRHTRSGPFRTEDRSRSRWLIAQAETSEDHRPQENGHLREFRVDRVEVHKSGSDGQSQGGHREDQLVYNLEVEESHNYFANGILVGNCHQAKSKGTGVGFALTSLTNAARYVVGLTGTLLNGYSTSIFWLWYRLASEVRNEFRFNDEQRWTEKYGLLKRTFYTDADGLPQDDGAFTGTKFHETVSERPGISPAIVGIALKYATFSSLKDVGLPLPAYSEDVVRIPMTDAMAEQYHAQADGSANKEMPRGLYQWAIRRMKDEDGRGAISVWLNTALNRPDAMFRGEVATFNYRVSGRGKWAVRRTETAMALPAITQDWLPKEKWTAEQCLAELRAGRKTLVYVRQTGERDLQPRLQECLQAHGLRVGVLKPSLAPAKRATWIKQHAPEWDVLLSNAKLVQVGLNLTTFSTAIFFELEWSLAVIWQAMRRLYRPGAPKPVKVFFPVYEGALEEQALNLIGAKMLAAMTFYGDEATGALVEESEGSLLDDLRKMVMGEMRELNVGRAEGLFAGVAHGGPLTSDSPLGNPVAPSPALVWPAPETLAARVEHAAQVLVARRKKANRTVGQLTLF